MTDYTRSYAEISGPYRFLLVREWDALAPRMTFVMLNPSTADGQNDDATIRRCVGLAKAQGFGKLAVVNLFALRTTDPSKVREAPAPIGNPWNDHWIQKYTGMTRTVCAWGAVPWARDRIRQVISSLPPMLWCFGETKGGFPRHPLYLPGDAKLEPYPLAARAYA